MATQRPGPERLARVAALAHHQDGVVGWDQMRDFGLSSSAISRLGDRGVLREVWPQVYRFGAGELTIRGWWWAGVLGGGTGSGLFARSASGLWGVLPVISRVDVYVHSRRGRGARGLHVHEPELRPQETTTLRGIPTTTLARTALDVAASRRGPDHLGRMLDDALLLERYDHTEMTELLEARRGCRGVRRLAAAVERLGDQGVRTRSRPERVAWGAIGDAGLRRPVVNAWFPTRAGHGYELDLYWPELALVVEVDGPRHLLPHQARLDRLRDADLRSFGIVTVRIADRVVLDEPERFLAVVRAALRQRIAESPSSPA